MIRLFEFVTLDTSDRVSYFYYENCTLEMWYIDKNQKEITFSSWETFDFFRYKTR